MKVAVLTLLRTECKHELDLRIFRATVSSFKNYYIVSKTLQTRKINKNITTVQIFFQRRFRCIKLKSIFMTSNASAIFIMNNLLVLKCLRQKKNN